VIGAQNAINQQTSKEDQETQKRKLLETKAYALLDELIIGLQTLRLPENRIRTEVSIARMLWDKDPNRARKLFQQATNDLAGLINGMSRDDSESSEAGQFVLALRQEVFQAFISSDPTLALEFLQATKIPPALAPNWAKNNEMELEAQVASAAASKDPEVALAAAQASLANGLSGNLVQTVSQLLLKDSSAAGKLLDDIAQKLSSEDFLYNQQASWLAMSLLDIVNQNLANSSHKPEEDSSSEQADAAPPPTLPDGTVRKLIEMLVRAALKGNISINSQDHNERSILTNIFNWLHSRSTLLDKYVPSLLQDLKKKSAQFQQVSAVPGTGANLGQLSESASPEAIVSAAASAPSYQRNDYYFQASMKAMNQGDVNLAVQIIEHHVKDSSLRDQYLQNLAINLSNSGKVEQAQKIAESRISSPDMRNNILMMVNNHKISDDLQKGKIEEAQSLALRLPVGQRVVKFIEIANALIANGKKETAGQLLESAWNTIPARAGNQEQLQAQLSLVSAFAAIDLAKATGCMQSIINQLNEMIRAAETINGFDIRYYKDDELLMQNGLLLSLVQQCGQILSSLAAVNFDTAKLLSEQFHRPEAKIYAQLSLSTHLIQNSFSSMVINPRTYRRFRSSR
jgi:hypothetical protein